MATITIFRTNLAPEKNALVEDLNDYLGTCTVKFYDTNFQYQKIELDMKIKVNVTQDYVADDYLGNYVRIYQDSRNYYFFILGTTWKSKNTVELELSLDTINTFANDLVWTDRTKIIRQHKDRFVSKNIRTTETLTYSAEPFDSAIIDYPFTLETTYTEHLGKNTSIKEVLYNKATIKDITITYDDETGAVEVVGHAKSSATVFFSIVYEYDTPAVVRKIDFVDENLNPVQYKETQSKIKDINEPDTKWYLIYKSDSTATEYQPVKCYCCADKDILYQTGGTYNTIIINRTALARGDALWFIYDSNDSDSQVVKMTGAHPDYTFTVTSAHPILKVVRPSNSDYLNAYLYNQDGSTYASYTDQSNAVLTLSYRYWKLATNNIQSEYIKANGEYHAALSGTINQSYINSINSYDRTDSTNIKIIELSYAPFNIEYGNDDTLIIPDNWVFDNAYSMLRLPNINSEFLNTNLEKVGLDDIYIYTHTPVYNEAYREDAESKLYNSEFRTIKLVYDNQSSLIKPEFIDYDNITQGIASFDFNIDYKPSNNISSACGWHFYPVDSDNVSYQDEGDYSSYLLANRDNEYPVYNSAWLNYNKYGRKFDKAANANSVVSSVAGTIAAVGSAAALFAFGGAAGKALSVSRIVGLVASTTAGIVSTATSIKNTINSQRAKEQELLSKSASVSGVNDLNLLKWYNGNGLELMVYNMDENIKDQIFNHFRLHGYAEEKYGIPVVNTRYWYNFIQCDPDFDDRTSTLYKEFMNDIKSRYQLGVTVYHKQHIGMIEHYHWDFEQQYENWEISLL